MSSGGGPGKIKHVTSETASVTSNTSAGSSSATSSSSTPPATTPGTSSPTNRPPSDDESSAISRTFEDNLNEDLDTILTPGSVKKAGYEVGARIGGGNFSSVYKATKTTNATKLDMACKLIRFDLAGKDYEDNCLKRELKITKKLKNQYVIKVYEVIKTHRRAFIFMELALGSLEDQLKLNVNGLTEDIAKKYFRQLASAVNYVHSKGIAHRDLKTENVLLDVKMNIKLADFGFARFCYDPDTKAEVLSETCCGTKEYQAPETYVPPYDARFADDWSLGVILFELLTNQLPYIALLPDGTEISTKKRLKAMNENRFRFPPGNTMSEAVKELIKKILESNVATRFKDKDIADHKWLK